MTSILVTIKKMLGLDAEQKDFDTEIIMHINSVLMILAQMGVGPSRGIVIEDEFATWEQLIPDGRNFELVKTYIYLKVKLIFDPPLSSSVLSSMERMISECEWRLNSRAEYEEETQEDTE